MRRRVTGLTRSASLPITAPRGRTCSRRSAAPSGFSTRLTSRSPRTGSATEQKTHVAVTVSNEPSGNGSASTSAFRSSTPYPEPPRAGPGPVEHPLRQVDPDELQARRVEVEVAAGADAHLEHAALSRLEHAPPSRGAAQPVHRRLDHVVDRGDAIVDALGGGSRSGPAAAQYHARTPATNETRLTGSPAARARSAVSKVRRTQETPR